MEQFAETRHPGLLQVPPLRLPHRLQPAADDPEGERRRQNRHRRQRRRHQVHEEHRHQQTTRHFQSREPGEMA